MRLRARWSAMHPMRQRALVEASVLLLGTLLFALGIVGNVGALAVVGAFSILGVGGFKLPTMDGWWPYSTWTRQAKIWYWVLWALFLPVMLALFWARLWVLVIGRWQSAPALVKARIAQLEAELAQPTEV